MKLVAFFLLICLASVANAQSYYWLSIGQCAVGGTALSWELGWNNGDSSGDCAPTCNQISSCKAYNKMTSGACVYYSTQPNSVSSDQSYGKCWAKTSGPVATVPGAPQSVSATSGENGRSTVYFSSGGDGGSSISYYTVYSNYGHQVTGYSSPIVVTGLSNGVAYSFRMIATNSVGNSAFSSWSNTIVPANPATVPSAPYSVSATSNENGRSTVSFAIPSDGGSSISYFTVTSNYGHQVTGSSSPIVVTGLTNGVGYTFTVTATNSIGTSAASSSSSTVVPATVPSAPTGVSATSNENGKSTISFAIPSNGGSSISQYTVTSSGGHQATGSSSPIIVTGLTNGVSYTFTVTATNSIGTSAASPSSTVVPATVPAAPTGVSATSNENGKSTVSFAIPSSNGGSSISQYTVTSSGGHQATGSSSPIVVTGLTNGVSYTFTVTATNSAGTSAASAASVAAIPATVPAAPTGVSATSNEHTKSTVSFSAPANNGGATIVSFTVTSSGGQMAIGSSSPIVVTGLTNGVSYTFTVTATNSAGTSAASAASAAAIPAPTLTPPTAFSATTWEISKSTLTWTAPKGNDEPVIGYQITVAGGQVIDVSASASSYVLTGLTNGMTYSFTMLARYAYGNSVSTAARSIQVGINNAVLPTSFVVQEASHDITVADSTKTLTMPTINFASASAIYSFSMWLKVEKDEAQPRNIFRLGVEALLDDRDRNPGVWLIGTKLHVRQASSANGNDGIDYSSVSLSLGAWNHVAVVVNSNTMTLYVNNQVSDVYRCSGNGRFIWTKSTPKTLGFNRGTSVSNGYIKIRQFYWYNAAFTAPQVALLNNQVNVPAPTAVSASSELGQSTVTWTAPAAGDFGSVIGYRIVLDGKQTFSVAATATSYVLTGLTPGKSYTLSLTARYSSADSVAVSVSFKVLTVLQSKIKSIAIQAKSSVSAGEKFTATVTLALSVNERRIFSLDSVLPTGWSTANVAKADYGVYQHSAAFGTTTFTVELTAPSAAGAYNFVWKITDGSNNAYVTAATFTVNVATGQNTVQHLVTRELMAVAASSDSTSSVSTSSVLPFSVSDSASSDSASSDSASSDSASSDSASSDSASSVSASSASVPSSLIFMFVSFVASLAVMMM